MSYSGDAAEQVVRMTLEGTEVAAKITGASAKQIALLIYAVLKDQKKTKGKTRLTNMLRSGKELKVFAVHDKDLVKFCTEAKKYGILYCVLKDKDASDGITDIMVRAEDASKINRIFERFEFATVDMGSVKSEIEHKRAEKKADMQVPERNVPEKSKEDLFLDALMQVSPTKEEAQTKNPTEARNLKSNQSEPFSNRNGRAAKDTGDDPTPSRRSVRQDLKDIREEQRQRATASKERSKTKKPLTHIEPQNKKTKKKER